MNQRFCALILGLSASFLGVACGTSRDDGTSDPLITEATEGDPIILAQDPVPARHCIAETKLRSASAGTCAANGHGGRARILQADILNLVKASLVDTGPMPSSGGEAAATLLELDVPNLGNASVATAKVSSTGTATQAEAAVAKVNLAVLGIGITADVLEAKAQAGCSSSGVQTTGYSKIANLRIAGIRVDVSGSPNQTLNVAGLLRVVINEQIPSNDGIAVRALHVTALGAVLGGVDLIVSSADARVSCSAQCNGCGGGTCPGGGDAGGGNGGSGCSSGRCDAGGGNGGDPGCPSGSCGGDPPTPDAGADDCEDGGAPPEPECNADSPCAGDHVCLPSD